MTSASHDEPGHHPADSVEMPRSTVWPMVLALGLLLMATGVATNLAISVPGFVLLLFGLSGWITQLLPGRGHMHEPFVSPELRPAPPAPAVGAVSRLGTGMPGYRLRLPIDMHPVSA